MLKLLSMYAYAYFITYKFVSNILYNGRSLKFKIYFLDGDDKVVRETAYNVELGEV